MAGWGRAAPSLSWMIWRWSQTPLFPAQRTSSAKPSRSPRISKSCCELLRRTNMRGQSLKKIYLNLVFSFQFLTAILSPKFLFLIIILLCLVAFTFYHFPFCFCNLHSSSLILLPLCCYHVVSVSRCVCPPHPHSCEQTM